jgi:phage recombination protein Bet
MSSAVATLANNLAVKLGMGEVGGELITTLKSTAFKGNASEAQFMALMVVANQYGLNPWTREIYAFPDKNNGIVPVVGVDGWSRIINDHTQFDGMTFEQDDESCTCIIYRKDRSHPISATEYLSECKRNTQPWQSHPKRMLRHKALIQCARLAFGYTGIYDQDEAERIVEINPLPSRVTGTQAAQAARPNVTIDQLDEKAKAELISGLEGIAGAEGLSAYGEAWMNLTKENRKLVGTVEHERMKVIAQSIDDANKPKLEVDPFIAEMEAAE